MPGVQQSSPQEITILHKNQQNWNSEKISFVQWWIRKKLIFFTIQKNWSFQLTVISCFEFYKQNYVNQKVNFYMRRRISTRGCVRPSVRRSVRRSVRLSVTPSRRILCRVSGLVFFSLQTRLYFSFFPFFWWTNKTFFNCLDLWS